MIQDVINNITNAESEAEEIIRIANSQAKEIRLQAETVAEEIAKQANVQCKEAIKLRGDNAEVAANKKAEQISKDGNKEIIAFTTKCAKNADDAVKAITEGLQKKYVNN